MLPVLLFLFLNWLTTHTGFGANGAEQPEHGTFRQATSGYTYQFPRDHGSHDQFRTEWWYYTGHLRVADGRQFGYELTFFRRGVENDSAQMNPSRWAIHHLYLAHFALSDHGDQTFHYAEKVSRAGLGKAGADTGRLHVWIDQWKADSPNPESIRHHLEASTEAFSLHVDLDPQKPPIVHGRNGISRKGKTAGQASHYYSMTRLVTTGAITMNGERLPVTGISWMDHEFGSGSLGDDQVGWDWFSLQLDNGTEIMLYLLRRRVNTVDPVSSGTLVLSDGRTEHLTLSDVQVETLSHWDSPASGARYPSRWRLSIPRVHLSLEVVPRQPNQELVTTKSTQVTYWEGAVSASGHMDHHSVSGQGYVELTGYAEPFQD
ncbi:MAG TPA: lipocalin-like domain-containing protein [Nitrospiraceae bacterium]|nr:lipocalin-like domain-containing protein [Nitrospiraceae bacterium]